MGFVLLSATVAWTLGVHPALARRRAVALRLSHVRRSRASADALDSDGGAALLDGLASAISVATVDFMQYPESYYFEDVDENTALPRHLGYAAALAEQAATARHPNVRLAGSVLGTALAESLDGRFLHTNGPTRQVFAAYAVDHDPNSHGK